MKQTLILASALVLGVFTSCTTEPEIIDSSQPQGQFTAAESGMFVDDNGAGSTGTAEVGTDEEGNTFLRFNNNFNTNLSTGTVTVYLSTSAEFMAAPGEGNPDLYLVGGVQNAGENYFKLDSAPADQFTHVLLWCGSVGVRFGYAQLQ